VRPTLINPSRAGALPRALRQSQEPTLSVAPSQRRGFLPALPPRSPPCSRPLARKRLCLHQEKLCYEKPSRSTIRGPTHTRIRVGRILQPLRGWMSDFARIGKRFTLGGSAPHFAARQPLSSWLWLAQARPGPLMDNLTNPWGAPTLPPAQVATACGRRRMPSRALARASGWAKPNSR